MPGGAGRRCSTGGRCWSGRPPPAVGGSPGPGPRPAAHPPGRRASDPDRRSAGRRWSDSPASPRRRGRRRRWPGGSPARRHSSTARRESRPAPLADRPCPAPPSPHRCGISASGLRRRCAAGWSAPGRSPGRPRRCRPAAPPARRSSAGRRRARRRRVRHGHRLFRRRLGAAEVADVASQPGAFDLGLEVGGVEARGLVVEGQHVGGRASLAVGAHECRAGRAESGGRRRRGRWRERQWPCPRAAATGLDLGPGSQWPVAIGEALQKAASFSGEALAARFSRPERGRR